MSVVETEFSFLQVQRKTLSAQAVELGQASFGIAPETLDPIDVGGAEGEFVVAMVDPAMFLETQIDEPVVAAPFVGMNNRLQTGLVADDRLQSGFGGIGHDLCIDLIAAFQQSEDDGFARRSTASSATHTPWTEVRFVGFQFAFKRGDLLRTRRSADAADAGTDRSS